MKIISLFFIMTIVTLNAHAQLTSAWIGHWSGPCQSTASQIGLPKNYILDFSIKKSDQANTYAFQAKYKTEMSVIEDKRYLLVPVDVKKGHYQVDEKNSIYLDTYFTDLTMVSLFTINGKVFSIQYIKNGDDIIVMMPRWNSQPKTISGGVGGIPTVVSFEQLDMDTCKLKLTN